MPRGRTKIVHGRRIAEKRYGKAEGFRLAASTRRAREGKPHHDELDRERENAHAKSTDRLDNRRLGDHFDRGLGSRGERRRRDAWSIRQPGVCVAELWGDGTGLLRAPFVSLRRRLGRLLSRAGLRRRVLLARGKARDRSTLRDTGRVERPRVRHVYHSTDAHGDRDGRRKQGCQTADHAAAGRKPAMSRPIPPAGWAGTVESVLDDKIRFSAAAVRTDTISTSLPGGRDTRCSVSG
jgi:hypothetical protein